MPFKRVSRGRRTVVTLLCCGWLASCASLHNLLVPYTAQMQASRQALLVGDLERAENALPGHAEESLLMALEAGRVAFVRGHWDDSRHHLAKAIELLEEQERQARFRVTQGLEQTASLLSNDSVTEYQAPAYERVMVHHYQALNFLFLGDLEGALVEVRRANLVQEAALKARENELSAAALQRNQQLTRTLARSELQLPSMERISGDLKSSFQNAYTFYTSAVLYELAGSPADAYIDYQRAYEIYPDNVYLQDDLLRLARQLGMAEDLRRFERQFGRVPVDLSANQGQLLVLYESGLVPARQSTDLTLPVQHGDGSWSWFRIALPVYRDSGLPAPPLTVQVDDAEGQSAPIVDLSRMCAKALEEEYPAILSRQVLRVLSKEQLRRAAQQGAGEWGNVLSNLYNVLSEQADTRSWLTLPHSAQIWRSQVASGNVELQLDGGRERQTVPVVIHPRRVSLVLVLEVNGHLYPRVLHVAR